jgi:hypothetical protein
LLLLLLLLSYAVLYRHLVGYVPRWFSAYAHAAAALGVDPEDLVHAHQQLTIICWPR